MASTDWLPSSLEGVMTMAKNWETYIPQVENPLNIPPERFAEFKAKIVETDKMFQIPQAGRTQAINAQLKVIRKDLQTMMRDIKRRYFFSPPLTDYDIVMLGLKPRDTEPTHIPDPTGQAEATITYPGRTQLQLQIQHVSSTSKDERAYYGCRIYHGVTENNEPHPQAYHLRESRFTRRKRELFTFTPTDSGKTAHFCIRYENSKGKAGPWGPVFSAIIP